MSWKDWRRELSSQYIFRFFTEIIFRVKTEKVNNEFISILWIVGTRCRGEFCLFLSRNYSKPATLFSHVLYIIKWWMSLSFRKKVSWCSKRGETFQPSHAHQMFEFLFNDRLLDNPHFVRLTTQLPFTIYPCPLKLKSFISKKKSHSKLHRGGVGTVGSLCDTDSRCLFGSQ